MNTPFEIDNTERRIVYVKAVEVADLPENVQAEVKGHDHIYAVHDAEGQQLALVANRKLAFLLARQHDLAPVAVH